MYLFEVNLNLLANTSTPDVAQYHLEYNFSASYLCCCSTDLAETERPMQYYTGMKMYAGKCIESMIALTSRTAFLRLYHKLSG